MKKILKYRVWDKRNKEMYYPKDKTEFFVRTDGELFIKIDMEDSFELVQLRKKDCIILEDIGQKDFKNKRIHDGDIVRFTKWGVQTIEWIHEHSSFGFRIDKNKVLLESNMKGTSQREIIGNVYENPELLK